MDEIGRYRMEGPLTNENAGFSQWGFGTCEGKRYFIKQFMSPTYPAQTEELGEKIAARKKAECLKYIRKKCRLFSMINQASDGNFLRIHEFFRMGGKFCIAAEALDGTPLEGISRSGRAYLLLTFTHSLAGIHHAGLVHGDIKLSNLIFTVDGTSFPVTKIIDVDGCFLTDDPPVKEDDLVCDQLYMAPEVFKWMCGQEIRLTEKIDVFSAGLIIYQILTDKLPGVSEDCRYPYTAVLNGKELDLYRIRDPAIRGLVAQMLSEDPERRPDMGTVFAVLRKNILGLGVQEDLRPAGMVSAELQRKTEGAATGYASEGNVPKERSTPPGDAAGAGASSGNASGVEISPELTSEAGVSPGDKAEADAPDDRFAGGSSAGSTSSVRLRGDLYRRFSVSTAIGKGPAAGSPKGRSTREPGADEEAVSYFHVPEDKL